MKFSELKGRAVVSLDNATKLGEVEDLMVEPGSRHIVGLKVRTGVFSAALQIPAARVQNVGADAVTVTANATPAPTAADAANSIQPAPEPQSAGLGSPAGAQPPVELTSILGNKVVTDAGTLVGELRDVLLDWTNLAITGYEVYEGGLFGKAREFTATPDVRFGDKIITVPAQLLSQPS